MSNYVISAPGAFQPEMRGTVEEQAPGYPPFTANNAPGYPDHIGTVKYSSLSELKVPKSVGIQY
jgi:hypothetical protein